LREMTREQILDLTLEEKLQYFKDVVTIQHPHMDQALRDILLLSARNTGTDILLLVGPSGVGKSATVKVLRRKFTESFAAQMHADASLIPLACVEAPASGELSFSWRILYSRIGEALCEPVLERKNCAISQGNRLQVIGASARSTVAALRVAI